MIADGGGEAWLASRKNGLGKLHHKLMVIDGALIVCGSFNYTDPANRLNDENILVLGDLEDEDPMAQAAQRRLGAYAMAENDRMIEAHGERVPLSEQDLKGALRRAGAVSLSPQAIAQSTPPTDRRWRKVASSGKSAISNNSFLRTAVANDAMSSAVITKAAGPRSEEHKSELQSLMRSSYAVFCLNKKHATYYQTH